MTSSAPVTRRALRAETRSSRQRRRIRGLAVSAAMLTGATLLGLGAAGGTYALLNARAELGGATISAGTAELRIDGAASASLADLSVGPGAPAARAVTVSNTGHVTLDLSARATPTAAPAILANTQIRLTPVSSAAQCVPGRPGPAPAPLSGYTKSGIGALAPTGPASSGTTVLCLELSLRDGTPVEQSGQQVPFTLTIEGVQRAG
ncbi:hypothetical protein [Leucobacter luti]|uniref:hypothetical protein n=1 Tax=Leucobacter luti TaxID=340320 RepID=UPI003D007B5D